MKHKTPNTVVLYSLWQQQITPMFFYNAGTCYVMSLDHFLKFRLQRQYLFVFFYGCTLCSFALLSIAQHLIMNLGWGRKRLNALKRHLVYGLMVSPLRFYVIKCFCCISIVYSSHLVSCSVNKSHGLGGSLSVNGGLVFAPIRPTKGGGVTLFFKDNFTRLITYKSITSLVNTRAFSMMNIFTTARVINHFKNLHLASLGSRSCVATNIQIQYKLVNSQERPDKRGLSVGLFKHNVDENLE